MLDEKKLEVIVLLVLIISAVWLVGVFGRKKSPSGQSPNTPPQQ